MAVKYEWFTHRDNEWGGVDVHGFRTEEQGLLKGQTMKCFVGAYNTQEEALAAYPSATPGSKWTDPQVSLAHLSDEEGYSDDWED